MHISSTLIFILCVSVSLSSCDTIRNCSCVYFRLDDIQDYYVTLQQKTIINLFETMQIPLTIGIIGIYWNTGDTDIMSTVSGALARSQGNSCFRMEVANHGWEHELFPNFTMEEQMFRMNQTQNVIKSTLNYDVKTFIAPFNEVNATTLQAAINVGFKYVSSEIDLDPPPYEYAETTQLFRFPVSGETGIDESGYQIPVPSSVTWSKIQSQIQQFGFAGVMIHPYEFSNWNGIDYDDSINTTTLNDLVTLLNLCRNSGLKIVLISEVDSFFNSSHIDPCPSLTTSPLTTSPLTTSPVTSSPLTTSEVTTEAMTSSPLTSSPLTTAKITSAALTTGAITTDYDRPKLTSGSYHITSGLQIQDHLVEPSENGAASANSIQLFMQIAAIVALLFIA